jgi:hypothetical protein
MPKQYLGDNIYVEMDNDNISLSLTDQTYDLWECIDLKPEVMEALIRYYKEHVKP